MNPTLQLVLRWLHLFAGIAWIGHLYFFNFVNANFAKTMDGPTKQKVVPELMPRALWWFRWGAMFTFLAGIGIIWLKYFVGDNAPGMVGNNQGLMDSVRGQWISFGGLFGTIMWFNVWFVIWPRQKKIIGWVKKGEKPPEMDGTVKVATLASKINTYLSGPMLFGMVAGSHAGDYGIEMNLMWLAVGLVGGLGFVHILYQIAPKVGLFKE